MTAGGCSSSMSSAFRTASDMRTAARVSRSASAAFMWSCIWDLSFAMPRQRALGRSGCGTSMKIAARCGADTRLGCLPGANSFHRHPQFLVPEGIHLGTVTGAQLLNRAGRRWQVVRSRCDRLLLGRATEHFLFRRGFLWSRCQRTRHDHDHHRELNDALKSMETYHGTDSGLTLI
jgi:hypothetical protein